MGGFSQLTLGGDPRNFCKAEQAWPQDHGRRWDTTLSCPHPTPVQARGLPPLQPHRRAPCHVSAPLWSRGGPLHHPLSSQTFIFTDGDDAELQLQGGERPPARPARPGPPLPTPLSPVPHVPYRARGGGGGVSRSGSPAGRGQSQDAHRLLAQHPGPLPASRAWPLADFQGPKPSLTGKPSLPRLPTRQVRWVPPQSCFLVSTSEVLKDYHLHQLKRSEVSNRAS